MSDLAQLFASLAFALGLAIVLIHEVLRGSRQALVNRLQGLDVREGEGRTPGRAVATRLARLGGRLVGRHENLLAERLRRAGFASSAAPAVYQGARILVGTIVGTTAALLSLLLYPSLAIALGAALYFGVVGVLVPRLWIGRRIRARTRAMRKELPDTLDLLIVCVEAGMGFTQALMRVVAESLQGGGPLAEELRLTLAEVQAGAARANAFRDLGERTGVDQVRSFATMIIQAERFGTPLGKAMRIHSDSLRLQRKQEAREAAAKTTIKLVFPLVFFIFPVIFLVILGPVGIQLVSQLDGILP